ncbi:hypothetical protein EJ110_NYTH05613 [Nymphaea thermarum]|nr:hypothetical protein EJ110_NYTH05613 [Nymphaea thermarum]
MEKSSIHDIILVVCKILKYALYDVTSLFLIIDIIGDVLIIVVPRNTTILVRIADATFCITEDNQTKPLEKRPSHTKTRVLLLVDKLISTCFEIDINRY